MTAPLTFFHDVARNAFSASRPMTVEDSLLLDQYLKHPELIQNTQNKIDKYGPLEEKDNKELKNETNLVEKASTGNMDIALLPVDVKLIKPNFWTVKGDYSLQFMQNFVSGNWYKGGESNYAMLGAVTMEANFNNKQKVKWDNKLEMKLGQQNSRTDSVHRLKSTEDLLRLTSKLGLQASKNWYYTLQMVANTQFTHSYKSNDPELYADFMAPFNLNLSLGMDYNVDWFDHRFKGTFHLAPVAYNMKYTRLPALAERLGIDAGHHIQKDLGTQFTVDLTWEFSDIIKWKTRMYGYTTFRRMEYEWENTFVFQLNRWLAAQLFVFPRFDDSVTRDGHHGYWQFKEFSSIGLTYSF